MAIARHGRVIENQVLNATSRLLRVQLIEDGGPELHAGRYIIVDSGRCAPNGKIVKRAYSLISVDAGRRRMELAVKRIDGAGGSAYMHQLAAGAELTFSGPWGRFFVPPEAASQRMDVVATDTGITCALGLLASLPAGAPPAALRLVWLAAGRDYFLEPEFVERRLPAGLGGFEFIACESVGDPRRLAAAQRALDGRRDRSDRLFLAGDGAVLGPLHDAARNHGLPEDRIYLECYFNNPAKKTA